MKARQLRKKEMFERVAVFGQTYGQTFATPSEARRRFANLASILNDLNVAQVEQHYNPNTSKEDLLDELRIDLQDIARTARAIALDEPGFESQFPAPSGLSQFELVAVAHQFVAVLKTPEVAGRFIQHELTESFVADLEADLAAIEQAAQAERLESQKSVAGTAAVERLIRAGMKEVLYLNAIVRNRFSRDAVTLRAWQSASHVARDPRPATEPDAVTPPPSTP